MSETTNIEVGDMELLRDYVANRNETAFRTLVDRHVDMVYATALRRVQEPHLADEATQAVFIALAKKATSLSSGTILAGWLFRAAQFAGTKAQRTESRRRQREEEAAQMNITPDEPGLAWEQISTQLDEALNELKEPERNALLLRFFERKSMAQVGSALGTSEGAAKMRVARALEQLRDIFQARGLVLPAALLAAALAVPAAQAAPAGLAAVITSSALQNSTLPLITKGTLLLMTWSKNKTIVAFGLILLLCNGITAVLTFALVSWHYAQAPKPARGELIYEMGGMEGAPVQEDIREFPGKGGRVRIITRTQSPDGTNAMEQVMILEGDGTNVMRLKGKEAEAFLGGGTVRLRSTPGRGGAGGFGIGGTTPPAP